MVTSKSRDYAEASPAFPYGDEPEPPKSAQLGSLRIAKITYDHKPIYAGKDGSLSIGAMVDAQIAATIDKGEMVSEVSLFFETHEMQIAIAEMYSKPTKTY